MVQPALIEPEGRIGVGHDAEDEVVRDREQPRDEREPAAQARFELALDRDRVGASAAWLSHVRTTR